MHSWLREGDVVKLKPHFYYVVWVVKRDCAFHAKHNGVLFGLINTTDFCLNCTSSICNTYEYRHSWAHTWKSYGI